MLAALVKKKHRRGACLALLSRSGWLRNTVAAGNLAHRLPVAVAALGRLALLVCGELRFTAELDATGFRSLSSLAVQARIRSRSNRDLDAPVAAAYRWPADLSEQEALAPLLAFNFERAGRR